jgi:hypothetical protein
MLAANAALLFANSWKLASCKLEPREYLRRARTCIVYIHRIKDKVDRILPYPPALF